MSRIIKKIQKPDLWVGVVVLVSLIYSGISIFVYPSIDILFILFSIQLLTLVYYLRFNLVYRK